MSWIRMMRMRVRGILRKDGSAERDLDEELRAHFEMLVEQNERRGMTAEDARRAARLELGGADQIKQSVHDQRGLPILELIFADLRYGARMLRKFPGFAAVAVLTLALGIGANTAIFSIIDSALLNPIPFPEPNRLVDIYASWPQFQKAPLSYPNFLDLQRENHSFEKVADWRIDWFTLTGSGDPERLAGEMVSADFLSVLGVQPVLGRSFRADDDLLGAAPVAMLGEGLWKRHFGSDRGVIGKSVTLNDRDYTIVGIVPSSVRLLHFQDSYFDEVFVPVGQWNNGLLRDRRFSMGLRTVGRLKSGATLAQAQAEMRQLQASLTGAYPNVNSGLSLTLDTLKDDQIGDSRSALLMLWGAVALVLLIACANVANLLLARASGRRHELAVRAALGASRGRIVGQLLTESVLLAAIGGAIGILLAKWSISSVPGLLPAALPATSHLGINSQALAFALLTSLLAGILFGVAPALKLSRWALQEKLQESHHRIAGSHRGMQAAFVAVVIGLALVLLSGAGLLIRSLEKVWAANPGFDPEGVLTCKVGFSPAKTSSAVKTAEAIRELTAKVGSIPGASSVGITLGGLPFELDSEAPVWRHEKPKPNESDSWPLAMSYIVGPGYFETMRVPLIRGRTFTAQDNASAPAVVVVDADLANSMFPGANPVGKALDFGAGTEPAQIVGVVGHVAQQGFDEQVGNSGVRFQVYSPSLQVGGGALSLASSGTTLIVRTERAPTSLVEPILQIVRSLDGNAVVYDVRTMHEVIAASLSQRRFAMTLLGLFAGIALVLAAIGIYGVVSYLVGQRTHEIGIRMALGARPHDILRDVLGKGGKMALAGVALGLAASFGLTRLLRSMLFGVNASDPLTLAAAVGTLLIVAVLACWVPARRAMRIDPIAALRHE